MARMSIDDMFLRDPRVRLLATACGWNKYETRGRLLDVFAVVYDRVDAGGDDVLTAIEIDTAAEFEGLAEHMIATRLADRVRDGVRIRGAHERTKYLATREQSGRLGGLKSGESRREKAKQRTKVTFAKNEGRVNPPDPVPDLVPDPVVASVPDLPAVADPDPDARSREGVKAIAPKVGAGSRALGELAEQVWSRVSEARLAVAKETRLPNVLPFPALTPAHHPASFRELLERLREEGAAAPSVADRVIANLIAQARDSKSLDWLSEKAFTAGGWRTAREGARIGPRSRAIGPSEPHADHPVGELEPFAKGLV